VGRGLIFAATEAHLEAGRRCGKVWFMTRQFLSFWRTGHTVLLVKLNIVMGGAAGLFALLYGAQYPAFQGLWVPAGLGLATAFYFLPMLSKRPVLKMNDDGFWLDALGFIPWGKVAEARRSVMSSPRFASLEFLELTFAGSVEEAIVSRAPAPPWRDWQVRTWSILDPRRIRVRFARMGDEPEAIRKAFEVFLHRPIARAGS
jgi:hypothetical protein